MVRMKKKTWKAALAVLLCVSMMAGWLAMPAGAVGHGSVVPDVIDPIIKTGTYVGSADIEGATGNIMASTSTTWPFSVVNGTSMPMKYTMSFQQGWAIVCHACGEELNPADVFSGKYNDPPWLSMIADDWDLMADGSVKMPFLMYLTLKGQGGDPDELLIGDSSKSITGSRGGSRNLDEDPWVHFGVHESEQFFPAERLVQPNSAEQFELNWAWPYDRTQAAGDPDWNDLDNWLNDFFEGVEDSFHNCCEPYYYGIWSPFDPKHPDDTMGGKDNKGGLGTYYWLEYKIDAEFPKVNIYFPAEVKDAGTTPWVVEAHETVADAVGGGKKYPALPTMPKNAQDKEFDHWVLVWEDDEGVTQRTKVTEGLAFNPTDYNLEFDDAAFVYKMNWEPVYKSSPPVVIKVKVGADPYPTDAPYEYTWEPADGGEPNPPRPSPNPAAPEGEVFDGWYLELSDGTKIPWDDVDFTDPEKYGLTPDDEGVYTFVFSASFKKAGEPEPEPDCEFPWLPLILGGGGLIGGAVVIGGLTLPWLIALPLLPILLLLGGKIIGKADIQKPGIKEKPKDDGKKPDDGGVLPPKTGDSHVWALVSLGMLSAAGLGMFLLRRRREEEELA